MKSPTIVFRTTSACNLDCIYCYDKLNRVNYDAENEKFEKKINEIVSNIGKVLPNKNISSLIIFHGGEPLLIKPKTYEELIQKLLRENPNLKFTIQTNGIGITEEFIELFEKYRINVGISLDGCNETQNCNRIYKNGDNSFDMVMNKINMLNRSKVNFGIIMTISKECIGQEKELYEFIAKNNLYCNIRPAFGEEGKSYVMTDEEYYNFFKNMFELWILDKEPKISLKQIKELYIEFASNLDSSNLMKGCATKCNCFEDYLSLDVDGNVYSCNRTYQKPEFYYGNLNKMEYSEIYEKMKRANEEHKKYIENSECKNCEIYEECKGGCPANAFMRTGKINSTEKYFCSARIMIKEYVKKRMEELGIIEEYKRLR